MNILIVTSWSFKDGLIESATLPYLRMISPNLSEQSRIFLITFEQPHLSISANCKKNIDDVLAKDKIIWTPLLYKRFGVLTLPRYFFQLLYVLYFSITHKIRVVHAFCPPAGVLGYCISLFLRARFVLDSYEPHAEAMVENGTWKKEGWKYRSLFFMEKKMSERADFLISATEGMRQYAWEKYQVVKKEFYIRPTCVDLGLFDEGKAKNAKLMEELQLSGKIVGLYAGKFGSIYMEKETVELINRCQAYWGDKFVFLLLTAHSKVEIQNIFKKHKGDYSIVKQFFIEHHAMPEYVGLADFAITPVKPVPSKKYCSPIKDGEYWAMGLPVIIPEGISDDASIIAHNDIGYVLPKLINEEYDKAIVKIDSLLDVGNRIALRQKIVGVAKKYRNYSIAQQVYNKIYTKLRSR